MAPLVTPDQAERLNTEDDPALAFIEFRAGNRSCPCGAKSSRISCSLARNARLNTDHQIISHHDYHLAWVG